MIPAQKIVKAFLGSTTLLTLATVSYARPASAQGPTSAPAPIIHSSGPILAAGGETVLVCAANNQLASLLPPSSPPATAAAVPAASVSSLNVTLQIVNGITGAILTQSQVTIPPLGSTETPPDPCVNYVVPAATFAPTTNLFVVRIELNPQPLPPGICRALSASVQVFTPDSNGNPTNIRTIAFEPPDPCFRPLFSVR